MRRFMLVPMAVLTTGCSTSDAPNRVRAADKPFVDKAIWIYSGEGKKSREDVLDEVDPAVVYLPTMVCVGLNLKKGQLGGDTTICFDGNGKQVLHYVNGD